MFILKYKYLKTFGAQDIIFANDEVKYILAYSTILSLKNYKWYFCVR